MQTSDFDYALPTALIAQRPIEPRDHARLMVINRVTKTIAHERFDALLEHLHSGDVLVWNNSKVFKARLFGRLISGTGRNLFEHAKDIEVFLVRSMENPGVWKALAKPAKHVRPGARISFGPDFFCEAILKESDGTLLIQFPYNEATVRSRANRYGRVPLPPYIKDERHELESYQTVYASAKREGSVAAPTAGFHFTKELIEKIQKKGVQFAEVCLHVGLGTFLPVKTERVEDHTMHSEWVEVPDEAVELINQAKREGRRIVAVGTTTARTLEGVAALSAEPDGELFSYSGDINLFITPGFQFHLVDALITNFHLPKSTLLMLVAAFAGDTEFMLSCYAQAVEEKYRFFSFGDAMIIQ
ncbi:MAG TPA: tRNA preQ1(34) S-adenosylmethionine ribosyltransferase-isomerase QueA [Candidatus Magasanikbacteria bacterium]|nr:MAG: tRNA preQ1(34) S-adenosylmethionine ribosyltransferase-isomerase QueA [Candidatus Magasanikbacteria bacterium RIFCSPLOWO2_02_FULL_47_16]OGH79389.1 MAG: tRNA preQ1(34) S-adenosylmethionine ribosyltransferase-isomerase QueA [Candidatus Magasanikbacteria bacterium RIFCSPHIGHO2_02_FULL_48_18]OGH82493.1 MAG: tRNA preQ1(34) S-adenosylmethionine ribosyltransferase-isomerase QueA [Candidatus Magasanikbacteria bacterium RIFCSPLOWO2_12_FULL_47_9b]HAZ28750.1 tRNA preQ1(34) S-adenosylmethionine ribo